MSQKCEECLREIQDGRAHIKMGHLFCDACYERLGRQSVIPGAPAPTSPSATVVAGSRSGAGAAIAIVIGLVLFVAGLVVLVTRHDLALNIVGSDRAVREAVFGGDSLRNALMGVTVPSAIAMVVGVTVAAIGFVRRARR